MVGYIYVAPIIHPQLCQFSSSEFEDGSLDNPRDAQEQIKFLNRPVLYCRPNLCNSQTRSRDNHGVFENKVQKRESE